MPARKCDHMATTHVAGEDANGSRNRLEVGWKLWTVRVTPCPEDSLGQYLVSGLV